MGYFEIFRGLSTSLQDITKLFHDLFCPRHF